ncbi:MAG: S-layer homology domain-containing protein [Oculatellaceae cyanobacterium bins.114]|nr:S-layer homology domain-containing protein [Oculatellaceae cyanobacterium bins.114]
MKFFPLLTIAGLNVVAIALTLPAVAQSTPAQNQPQTGCLSGNPDGTFRGDQPLTRDEFAAGLSACLDQALQQIQSPELVTREDFEATLQRQQDLNGELRELSQRLASPTSDPTRSTSNP